MTTPPKTFTIRCPQCQNTYIDWVIPTLTPGQAQTTTCSKCGHRAVLKRDTAIKKERLD